MSSGAYLGEADDVLSDEDDDRRHRSGRKGGVMDAGTVNDLPDLSLFDTFPKLLSSMPATIRTRWRCATRTSASGTA